MTERGGVIDETKRIVDRIEREAGRRSREVRLAATARLSERAKAFKEQTQKDQREERNKLAEIERWRIGAIAAVDPHAPVNLGDIRSVKRETNEGAPVSVARLKCLEGESADG